MKLIARIRLFVLLFLCLRTGSAWAGVVFSAHGWKFQDVTRNTAAIQAAGYTAILLSPHQSSCAGGYGNGYDPWDFTNFDSGFGTEADLKALVDSAHRAGLQIYADMVLNHMCTRNYVYPRFSYGDFHHNGGITNWSDQNQLENNDLLGLNDLAQESPYVRGELFNYVVKTNNLGFDGYRWDAAKHVPKWFWHDHILNNVNAWGKYNFGEVYDSNLGYLGSYVAAGMSVTDYALYFAISNAFRFGGDLSTLDGVGYAAVDGVHALTFVENQDVGAPPNRLLAYAFLAAYPGYPCFANVDLNDKGLNNLAWIHNNKANGNYVNRYRTHDAIVFERAGNLLAGMNQAGATFTAWVATSWKNQHLHDYAATAADIDVNGAGYVQITIPPQGYVMYAP